MIQISSNKLLFSAAFVICFNLGLSVQEAKCHIGASNNETEANSVTLKPLELEPLVSEQNSTNQTDTKSTELNLKHFDLQGNVVEQSSNKTEPKSVGLKHFDLEQFSLEQNNLLDVISSLPRPMRELFARSYISARLRRYSMYPGEKSLNHREKVTRKPLLGTVPIIPEGVATPNWIPGELIASQVTKRQLKLIDDSIFGPLKSATMFPSVLSTILVFNKRYDPIRLGEVLKAHFGIESEPNGMILEFN